MPGSGLHQIPVSKAEAEHAFTTMAADRGQASAHRE
jgi:hypothetical protein